MSKHTLLALTMLALQAAPVPAEPVPEGGPLTSGYGYDAEGRPTTVNLPKGNGQSDTRQNTHGYDSLGRRITSTLAAPTRGASAPQVRMGYDGLGQIRNVTDLPRDIPTNYTANGLGNITVLDSRDSGITQFTYWEDGRVKTRTDARGKLTQYSYDDLGRLTLIDYATGKDTQFEYDGGPTPPNTFSIGQLSKITDESGTTTYSHDGFGRVINKTVKVSGLSPLFRLDQTWGETGSETGHLKTQTYPSRARLNYTYDTGGRLQSITLNPVKANGIGTNQLVSIALLSDIKYNGLNAPLSWRWGDANGVLNSRSFDGEGRLQSYFLGNPYGTGSAAGLKRTIAYDAAGRIASFTHVDGTGTAKPAYDQTFAIDGLDRLTQQQQQATTYGYGYDLSGNRQSQNVAGTAYVNGIEATSNQMIRERGPAGVSNFVYDAAGNLAKVNGVPTYTHSARGRLASVAVGADTVSYLYNGLEQRMVKSSANTTLVPGGARYFAYDEQGHPIGEYDQSGNPVYEVVYMGDTPVAVITQTRTVVNGVLNVQTNLSYVYSDHIDTPRVIVRAADQAIQWRWDQAEAYGNSPPHDNPSGLGSFAFNLRFPGQIYDAESNLVYNHHRYYDASTGRYVESDPIGLAGGINPYAYVDGYPLGGTDPEGLKLVCVWPAGGCRPNPPPTNPDLRDGPTYTPNPDFLPGPTVLCKAFPIACAAAGAVSKMCNEAHDCDKEWREARATCVELIREQQEQDAGRRKRRNIKGVTGGYYDIESCARGLVSEQCGGNRVTQ